MVNGSKGISRIAAHRHEPPHGSDGAPSQAACLTLRLPWVMTTPDGGIHARTISGAPEPLACGRAPTCDSTSTVRIG